MKWNSRARVRKVWRLYRRRAIVLINSFSNSATLSFDQHPMENSGFIISNFSEPSDNGTLLVLGNGRGGTSLVSGVLYHLGVFMGDDCESPSYENKKLTDLIVGNEKQAAKNLIRKYSQRFTLWGYKHPIALNFIIKHSDWFSEPKLIVIMKDVASIAARQSQILGRDPIWIMKRTLKTYNKIIKFSERSKLPTLFVSYEKILSNPLDFIRAIQSFTGINPDERQIAFALEFIDADSEDYKQFCASKYRHINKDVRGCVDVVQPEQIAGWAMDGNTGKPVEVILNVNGVDVERTIANLAQDNVNKKEFSIKGECSFEFNNLSKDLVKDGSVVRVFISNPRVELLGSPKIIGQLIPNH